MKEKLATEISSFCDKIKKNASHESRCEGTDCEEPGRPSTDLGEMCLALRSHLLAPRSEPETSVVNFVLRHSGLERGRMSKDILPFPLSAYPTAAEISL